MKLSGQRQKIVSEREYASLISQGDSEASLTKLIQHQINKGKWPA